MPNPSPPRPKRIGLFSTPWPLYNRPSVQLGALKAYLQKQYPELEVNCGHFYLQVAQAIGYRPYQAAGRKSWQAECVYAALLYPERFKTVEKLFHKEAPGGTATEGLSFQEMAAAVETASKDIIRSTDWTTFDLAGFSVCLCQFTSTLYFIREIKKHHPELKVVIGGSLVSGISPAGFFAHFPEIDFIVGGEGERPLGRLAGELLAGRLTPELDGLPGIAARGGAPCSKIPGFDQLEDLSALPFPDYDDYFALLAALPATYRFFPNLPVEISRGCWWRSGRKKQRNKREGCAFCNLNLQWQGYRAKAPEAVAAEIDALTSRHQTLSVSIVDNVLPVNDAQKIFTSLRRLNKDLNLFCEVRASLSPRSLVEMSKAGVRQIQIGIEALSSSLLHKMNKGTTAIRNIEMMKHCEELGIVNTSNLILHFPGSDEQDVTETLRCLEFVLPFRPLKAVQFRLGLGSPVMRHAEKFGLTATFNHPSYRLLLPPVISDSLSLIHQAYRGDLLRQKKIWRQVEVKVDAWQAEYAALRRDSDQGPILGYQDGRDFLIIRQKRMGDDPLTHRLEGVSRKIYLFCRHQRKQEQILSHFPGLSADKLTPFLNMMTAKRLMFAEGDGYLSLAVALNASRAFSSPLQSPYD